MRRFIEIVKKYGGKAVALLRHAKYLIQHENCRGDKAAENLLYAANYAELDPSFQFLLSHEGCTTTWRQGKLLGRSDLPIAAVIGSEQGRGWHTALCLAEGIAGPRKRWPLYFPHACLNYPVYNFFEAQIQRERYGDCMVPRWFNGELPGLVRDTTPRALRGRLMGFIEDTLERTDGLVVMSSHFEPCLCVANELVYGESLGNYSLERFPNYNHGTLIVRTSEGQLQGFPFNERWEILEPVELRNLPDHLTGH